MIGLREEYNVWDVPGSMGCPREEHGVIFRRCRASVEEDGISHAVWDVPRKSMGQHSKWFGMSMKNYGTSQAV